MDTLGDGEVNWGTPEVSGTGPCPRAGHSANLVERRVFIFGGAGVEGRNQKKSKALNDVHVLELGPAGTNTGRWLELSISGAPPEGRWRHSATTVMSDIYVFGGLVDDRKRFNDLFSLDCEGLAWHKQTPSGQAPAPRAHHTATYVEAHKSLFLFGGYGGPAAAPFRCNLRRRRRRRIVGSW
jgi:N-acetylneuraminic acid mutarotase